MSCRFQLFTKFSRLGLVAAVVVVALSSMAFQSAAADDLTIGSKAPQLDIEHWVSDRDGELKHVSEFEKDKVYVVEFWATWCGPCIRSMPHLAELQDKMADKGVQLISVSREDLETVEKFLAKKVPGSDDEQTYGELTSAYCLTTDPDGSVNTDYMKAAGQGGIPTAFIVGKDGHIEWIGHPTYPEGAMDKVLEEIVAGKWDREKFAVAFKEKQQKELEAAKANRKLRTLSRKLRGMKEAGDAKGALKELDAYMADVDKDSMVYKYGEEMRLALMMEIGGPEAAKVFATAAAKTKDPQAINGLAWRVVEKVQAGDDVDPALLKVACDAAERAVEIAKKGEDKKGTAAVMDTHANLLFLCDKLDEAIKVQKAATELSDDEQLADFYKKLLEAKKKKDA